MRSPNLTTNYICKTSLLFTFLLLLLATLDLSAQQKAFPSAYGGGAYATGGRGGNVYHVTSILDDGSIGTFRWAVNQPRGTNGATIVFDVSGEILLQNDLSFSITNLTIAGQSAPQGGITFTEVLEYPAGNGNAKRFRMRGTSGNDVTNGIVRYIRVRIASETNVDSFEMFNSGDSYDLIWDHISVSFGGDEGLSFRGNNTYNITLQNSIVAENFSGSLFGNSWNGSQSDIQAYNLSMLNNFWFNNPKRNPNATSNGRIDFVNNLVHDWQTAVSAFYGSFEMNYLNNYFSLGRRNQFLGSGGQLFGIGIDEDSGFTPQLHIAGNYIDKGELTDPFADNKYMVSRWKSPSGPNDYMVDPANPEFLIDNSFPLIGEPFTIKAPQQARLDILGNSGACHYLNADGTVGYHLDPFDQDYVDIASVEGDYRYYFREDQTKPYQNGWNPRFDSWKADLISNPVRTPINTRPVNFYVSNSHIPETWFLANVPNGQDHNDIAPSGYTWLEEYINGVDTPSVSIGVEGVEVTPNVADIQIADPLPLLQLTTTFTPSNATNTSGIWTSSDESIATVDDNGQVTAVSEGVVTITFTTNDGGFTDTSEITVFPEALQASAGSDQQICEGESTTLEASGGTNYVWNTGETTVTIEVTPNETTTYSVTVSDDFGQSDEVSVTVTVNAIPVADAGEDQTICEGESITLTATGGTSYLWSTGETTDSIEVNPILETIYNVEVTSNNCSSNDDVTIFVNDTPNITITDDIVIVEGVSTTLSANGGDNYEWSTSEITESISVSPIATTTYSVSSLGINGCTGYAEVTVTVIPEIIADAGADVTICSGETVTLSASGGVTYTWDTGDTGSELIVTPIITTTYIVTAEDDYGYTDTDSVTIVVNDIPEITVDDDIYIMIGNSTTLTANGGDTYSWSSGETTAAILVSPDVTTTYTVTGFSVNGCENTADVLVTVVEELNANAGEDVSICIGESITLSASGGITFTWNTGDTGASPTFSPIETTTYTVTVTDGFGNSDSDDVTITVNPVPIADAGEDQTVCEGEPVTLIATGGDSYLWSTGDTTASITVSPIADTVYTVEVFANNCSDSDSVTLFTLERPDVTVSDDIVIMTGNSTTLAAAGGSSYSWNTGETTDTILVSPTDTTVYTVTGFSANGCQSSTQVTVTVIPELIANAGNDVTICSGESVTLNASGGVTYTWNTGDSGSSPTISPTVTTLYTVTVNDGFGNSDSDSVTVTVNELPNVTVSENITIIEGESTNLLVNGAETYLWNTGETSSTINVNPSQTTTYTVTGTTNTCSAQVQVTVTVEELFEASAGADERVCDNNTYEVVLTANLGDSYLWNTGDTTQTIIVSPLSTTNYTVTVTQGEQEDTDDVTVYVDPSPDVVIANGNNVEILNGDFITLSASGANTYEWNNGATQPNIAVSPTSTTTYEVKGYVGDCYDEKQVTVNVLQPVVADAGEDAYICLGEVATLTATGGDEYEWSTGESTQTIQVSPTETTDYTVTVFNALDFDEASVTVDVDANCEEEPVDPENDLLDFTFDIFPNPASNVVNVKLSGTSIASDIYIYDLTGKLIKNIEISNENLNPSTTTRINISNLQTGVYFVKIMDQDRVVTKKLIVDN